MGHMLKWVVAGVIGGKYFATTELTRIELIGFSNSIQITDEDMAIAEAITISRERDATGEPIDRPPGQSATTAKQLSDFPADVAAEARVRWENTPPAERFNRKRARTDEIRSEILAKAGDLRREAFWQSFSAIDAFFFLLAIATAFKIGSGLSSASLKSSRH